MESTAAAGLSGQRASSLQGPLPLLPLGTLPQHHTKQHLQKTTPKGGRGVGVGSGRAVTARATVPPRRPALPCRNAWHIHVWCTGSLCGNTTQYTC